MQAKTSPAGRRNNSIQLEARCYQNGDLDGYELAFVATDDDRVNASVYQEGKSRGVWVNAADDPAHCDFILPSVLRRGDLTVAVSSGGQSPALARTIREELEIYFSRSTSNWRSLPRKRAPSCINARCTCRLKHGAEP